MIQTPDTTPNRPRRWPRRTALTSLVAVLVTGGALAGVGAAGPNAGDTVFACVKNNSGAVRIVSSSRACERGETLRTWAVDGPAGPQGPPGTAGPKGDPGAPGAPGSGGGVPSPHQVVVGTMTVEGITGPNADGSIDLLSFAEGLRAGGDGGSGAGAGKPTFTDVTVSKIVDATSAAFLQPAAMGQAFPPVVIQLFAPGSTTVIATYELDTLFVMADSIENDGSSPGQLLETIQLHFRRITFTAGGSSFMFDTAGPDQ